MDKIQRLFQPFRLKSLELKNRIVMAPMTRSFSPGGIPASNVADYYPSRERRGRPHCVRGHRGESPCLFQ